jgi:hypothetical protein
MVRATRTFDRVLRLLYPDPLERDKREAELEKITEGERR